MTKKLTLTEYRNIWRSKGLCLDCGAASAVSGATRCVQCVEKHKTASKKYMQKNAEVLRQRYQDRRLSVLRHYGIFCVCCGETEPRFLTLDHVNSDGYLHRQNVRKDMYRWAIANNYPDTLQVMCFNCNCGRAHNNGVCPHVKTQTVGASHSD
jgi:hypothetical protein